MKQILIPTDLSSFRIHPSSLDPMPTYEYQCQACQHEFEKFQPMSAAPIKKCPSCGKSKVRRLIGAGAGLIFKGSGFYITDYRDAGYQAKAKADTAEGKPAETKSTDAKAGDTKSDAKPSETKAEAKPAESKPADSKPAEPKASKSASKSAKKK